METAYRKKLCQYYQPHLDFTKPPKVGHLGARLLENDSLSLHYLSADSSHLPPPLLFLRSPLSLLSSPFPFHLPASPVRLRWCCIGVGGIERRWSRGCRVPQQSAFIRSLQGRCIREKSQQVGRVIQQNQDTITVHAFLTSPHKCWQILVICRLIALAAVGSHDMKQGHAKVISVPSC